MPFSCLEPRPAIGLIAAVTPTPGLEALGLAPTRSMPSFVAGEANAKLLSASEDNIAGELPFKPNNNCGTPCNTVGAGLTPLAGPFPAGELTGAGTGKAWVAGAGNAGVLDEVFSIGISFAGKLACNGAIAGGNQPNAGPDAFIDNGLIDDVAAGDETETINIGKGCTFGAVAIAELELIVAVGISLLASANGFTSGTSGNLLAEAEAAVEVVVGKMVGDEVRAVGNS